MTMMRFAFPSAIHCGDLHWVKVAAVFIPSSLVAWLEGPRCGGSRGPHRQKRAAWVSRFYRTVNTHQPPLLLCVLTLATVCIDTGLLCVLTVGNQNEGIELLTVEFKTKSAPREVSERSPERTSPSRVNQGTLRDER